MPLHRSWSEEMSLADMTLVDQPQDWYRSVPGVQMACMREDRKVALSTLESSKWCVSASNDLCNASGK